MLYGHNATVHGTEKLDIVVDRKGNIKEVWFRCIQLPFVVSRREKRENIAEGGPASYRIVAIDVETDATQRYQVNRNLRNQATYPWYVVDRLENLVVANLGSEETAREFARQLNEKGRVEFEAYL